MGRLIRLDWAIKKILRDKANFEILEGFLSELLGIDVSIQEILESESNKNRFDDKFNRVDILVKDEKGKLFIIEVQNESEADYLHRLAYGTSKVMVEHMVSGAPYSSIKKLYSVSIVYFDLGEGKDYLYHGTTNFVGMRQADNLNLTETQRSLYGVSNPADLFPEYFLIKVPRYDNRITDTLDEWIFFLKNEEIKESFKAKGLKAARDKLDILKMSEGDRKAYETYLDNLHYKASMFISNYREGEVVGYKKGHEEGREEGRDETRRAFITKLKDRGMSLEEISEIAEIPLSEVKRLLNFPLEVDD